MDIKFVIKRFSDLYLYIWYRAVVFFGVLLIIIFYEERGFYPDYLGPFLAFGLLILVIKHSFDWEDKKMSNDLANRKKWETKRESNYTKNEIRQLIILSLEILGRVIIAGLVIFAIDKIDYRLAFPLDGIDSGILSLIFMFPLFLWIVLPLIEMGKILKE